MTWRSRSPSARASDRAFVARARVLSYVCPAADGLLFTPFEVPRGRHLGGGRSSCRRTRIEWLEGVMLLAVYVVLGLAFYRLA